MDNSNHVVFKKIPLSVLISALHDAWSHGAEFIDLSGTPDAEQDFVSITVKQEYLDSNDNNAIDFVIEKEIEDDDSNLSDEDFNPLI